MLHQFSLKGILLEKLIANKKLTRNEVRKTARENGYMESNAERRMRELCEEFPIKPYDVDNKPCTQSKFISYWKLYGKIKTSTIFRSK